MATRKPKRVPTLSECIARGKYGKQGAKQRLEFRQAYTREMSLADPIGGALVAAVDEPITTYEAFEHMMRRFHPDRAAGLAGWAMMNALQDQALADADSARLIQP